VGQDGKAWEKIKSWFDYRIYLIADADVELSIANISWKKSTFPFTLWQAKMI